MASAPYVGRRLIVIPAHTVGWGDNKREVPEQRVEVEVSIDVNRIFEHFGRNAAENTTGRARALAGMIKAKRMRVAK